jgi:hypothetical protein
VFQTQSHSGPGLLYNSAMTTRNLEVSIPFIYIFYDSAPSGSRLVARALVGAPWRCVPDSRLEPDIEDAKWDEAGGGIRGNVTGGCDRGVTKFDLTCARRVAVEWGDKGMLEDDGGEDGMRDVPVGRIRVGGGDADVVELEGVCRDLPGRGVKGLCRDFVFECLDRTPLDEGETGRAGEGTSMRMLSLRLENPEPLLNCRALPRFFRNSSPNSRSSSSTVAELFRASRTYAKHSRASLFFSRITFTASGSESLSSL